MMRASLIVLVLSTGAACTSGTRQSPTLRTHQYPDGRPHFQYQLKDKMPHGEGLVWYPNGELKSRGEYVNGVKHGLFKFYRDDGELEHQAFFYKNVEVWRSTSPDDRPSDELLAGLVKFSGSEPRLGAADMHGGNSYEIVRAPGFTLDKSPPAPLFANLDRANSLDRVGMQVGFSDAGQMGVGAVTRIDAFGNYRFSRFGVYGQFSQTSRDAASGPDLTGRRTLEGGATFHRPLPIGGLVLRAGAVVPITNDDPDGFLAASAAAFQRPADAVTSFPASLALRTGATLTRGRQYFVLQGDTGIDWIAGSANGFDALARLNLGVGVGIRSLMLSAELANTVRITDPSRRMHGVGMSSTVWVNKTWLMVSMLFASEGHTTLSGAVGYEL